MHDELPPPASLRSTTDRQLNADRATPASQKRTLRGGLRSGKNKRLPPQSCQERGECPSEAKGRVEVTPSASSRPDSLLIAHCSLLSRPTPDYRPGAMFSPLRTDRLVIRAMRPSDGEALWVRRNDPEVSRYQDWSTPFPREHADELARDCAVMEGPQIDNWWMAVIELVGSGETVGDLAVHVENDGHTAEIGYTLASNHWQKGYAVEATEALVEYLFDTLGVDRVFGMLHPDNRPSAVVLERVGMLFEGHTRMSYWLDGEGSDDWVYGMLRDDWDVWRTRPRSAPEEVRLAEVTPENLAEVFALRTHKSQESFVAPMPRSLAQALRPDEREGKPIEPWLRAIEADGEIVGFAMMALVEGRDPSLWRLLIDRIQQHRGIGSRAMELIEAEARRLGGEHLLVGFNEGRGSPGPFYLARGFEVTGHEGETKARKRL